MGEFLGLVLTVLLIAANAFFVGAEFALISARRDRLEALAEQGKRSAVTVIRAGENLAVMLAGAQLGITIGSIILGRVGEPGRPAGGLRGPRRIPAGRAEPLRTGARAVLPGGAAPLPPAAPTGFVGFRRAGRPGNP